MIDWQKIAEIAITCIASVGGVGAIIVGIIKFGGDKIAERLSMKYQLQLDKEKERYRTELNKKEYVSKTRFDTEFAIYRELTSSFSRMVIGVCVLVPYGLVSVPLNEDDRKKQEHANYLEAKDAAVEAQNVLHANTAFISKELCKKYNEILELAKLQLDAYLRRFNVSYLPEERDGYNREDYQRTKELQDKWNDLVDRIRDYLANLEVIS